MAGSKRQHVPFRGESRQSSSVDKYAISHERCRKTTNANPGVHFWAVIALFDTAKPPETDGFALSPRT
jgi:hypothetical protein